MRRTERDREGERKKKRDEEKKRMKREKREKREKQQIMTQTGKHILSPKETARGNSYSLHTVADSMIENKHIATEKRMMIKIFQPKYWAS